MSAGDLLEAAVLWLALARLRAERGSQQSPADLIRYWQGHFAESRFGVYPLTYYQAENLLFATRQ